MRLWYIKRRNVAILNTRMLLLFGAALIILLAWIMPHDRDFRDMLATGQADQVSIAYAKLLLSFDPDDGELRTLLASQYYQIGQFYSAWEVIKDHPQKRSVIGLEILQKVTYGWPAGVKRLAWEAQLVETLESLILEGTISPPDLSKLVRIARGLDRPLLAALLLQRAFRASQRNEDLILAVRAWLAADRAENARELLRTQQGTTSAELVDLRIFVAQATDRPLQALHAIDDYISGATPTNAQWVRFANAALTANSPAKIKQYLSMIRDIHVLTLDEATQLSRAAVASGALSLAMKFMQHALSLGGDQPELSARMAQVHEWTGEAESALLMWSQLAERHADPLALDRAWRLARALYQYTNASFLLGKLSESRRLTDEEMRYLRRSYEQSGAPERGERVIQRYLQRVPQHAEGWRELIALQTANQTLERVEESWLSFSEHHEMNTQDLLDRAHVLWRQYRSSEALNLLLSWRNEKSTAYWQLVSAYAWFLDDRTLAADALENLIARSEPLQSIQYEYLIHSVENRDPARALEHAKSAYAAFPDRPEFLLEALRMAVNQKDSTQADAFFETIFSRTQAFSLIIMRPDFWGLRAQHLQNLGDLRGARQALAQALAIAPADAGLQATLIWLLVAAEDSRALAKAVARYAHAAERSASLWPALASAYRLLGDDMQASYWYAKALADHAQDVGFILAYSATLESLGRRDPAFRLRQYALEILLTQAERNGGIDVETLMWASRSILSAPEQKTFLLRLIAQAEQQGRALPSTVNAARWTFALADNMRRQHYTAARYWLQQTPATGLSAELAIAVDSHDKNALTEFLTHNSREVRVQAALALGDSSQAKAYAGDSGLSFPYGGWQARPQWSRSSNVQRHGSEFRLRGHLARRKFDADILVEDIEIKGHQDLSRAREISASGRVHYNNYLGAGSVAINIVRGGLRSFAGASVMQNYRLDRRNSFQAKATLRERVRGGGVAGALLDQSGLEIGWSGAPARRQQLAGRLHWYQYRGPGDTVVGDSRALELTHSLMLIRSGISADLKTSVLLQNSDQRALSESVNALLVASGAQVVPGNTRRVGVGAVLWRETPGELGWRRSTPHYRLETQFGYQWPQKQLTYEVDLAFGMAVFGRDELSLRAGFANMVQNVQGQTSIRAALGYSRSLDW